jgi:hypothetical protein
MRVIGRAIRGCSVPCEPPEEMRLVTVIVYNTSVDRSTTWDERLSVGASANVDQDG